MSQVSTVTILAIDKICLSAAVSTEDITKGTQYVQKQFCKEVVHLD